MCLHMGSCACHSDDDYAFVSVADVISPVLSMTCKIGFLQLFFVFADSG